MVTQEYEIVLSFNVKLLVEHPDELEIEPSGQISHFSPLKPTLHLHRPVSGSQSGLAEPIFEHLHSKILK